MQERGQQLLGGVLCIAVGSVVMLIGKPAPDVPRWVAFLAGAMFLLAGLSLSLAGLGAPKGARALAPLIAVVFAVPFNWLAFGEGERACHSYVALAGIPLMQGIASCRAPWIVAALFVDGALLFLLWYNFIRKPWGS